MVLGCSWLNHAKTMLNLSGQRAGVQMGLMVNSCQFMLTPFHCSIHQLESVQFQLLKQRWHRLTEKVFFVLSSLLSFSPFFHYLSWELVVKHLSMSETLASCTRINVWPKSRSRGKALDWVLECPTRLRSIQNPHQRPMAILFCW